MQFNNSAQAIYLQIAAYISEKVILKQWQAGDKIPSVRELSVELEVNPNTVMRAYEYLKNLQIIFDKRGIGYFIADNGWQLALDYRRNEFMEKALPQTFHNLYLLDLDFTDLEEKFEQYKKQFERKK